MGRAKIDGRPIAVTGDDFTVRGGSADATIKEKDIFIERYANQYRVPLIRMIEGSGAAARSRPSRRLAAPTCRACALGMGGAEHGRRADRGSGPRFGRRAGCGTACRHALLVMVKESPRCSSPARRW